jgi:hypothetical protein
VKRVSADIFGAPAVGGGLAFFRGQRVFLCGAIRPAALRRRIINYNQLYGRRNIMHVAGRLFVRTLAINQRPESRRKWMEKRAATRLRKTAGPGSNKLETRRSGYDTEVSGKIGELV